MSYVIIQQYEKDGKIFYTVNAISLPIKNRSVVQKIPNPNGDDILIFDTLEEAKKAVLLSGFSYILPSGKKGASYSNIPKIEKENTFYSDYENIVIKTIKKKVNSLNSNVAAAAISALSEFPSEETFNILFEKLGDDNDLIRKNAINGICAYGSILQNKIIETLKSTNWVSRNSAILCIINLTQNTDTTDIERYIIPLVKACDDSNTIVQSSALTALCAVYNIYRENKNKSD